MITELEKAANELNAALAPLHFSSPVTHTYNPLVYAWQSHRTYLERYACSKKRVLFLGMNPGPWGMAQTGIPFGEIPAVRDWMGIQAPVSKPDNEHPKRPIEGFDCSRSEVSGRRLWGLFAERYPNAQDFFADHFVANFCPLVWMADTGRNITPDKLPKAESAPVDAACLKHLATLITLLEPEFLIGVGAFAEKQLKTAVKQYHPNTKFKIGKILHPSPASPLANKSWPELPEKQLIELGVWH
ncbi:uracil-DNA glycosylase family protein [Rubritalea tangerina]|uniref:Uracil-DNA glycosylase family protein n=1 Tax=Rubritalea tangerina TaxID=430798 RepID=A0ABW4ZC29_9BACT